jgi:heat-inducible transcriptional repressor
MGRYAKCVGPIIKIVYEVMNEIDNGELRFSGIDHLLQYPEYNDTAHLKNVIGTLENKEEILNLVSHSKSDEVKVFIGSESSVKEMNNSAIAFKPIIKNGKQIGAIGVIGPLRMDYAKVMATLEELSENISNMIDPARDTTANNLLKGGE